MVSDSFVDFQGIVVACQKLEPTSVTQATPLYEVTLFYDSITDEQCAALLLASRQRSDLDLPSAPSTPPDPFGFDRVCGLN